MSASIKLQVSTADVLFNVIFGSNEFQCLDFDECDHATDRCHDYATYGNTIDSCTCECNTGFAGDGFEMLILMNAMITHVILLQLVPTALVHSAAHVITNDLVMDSLVLITTNAKMVFNG